MMLLAACTKDDKIIYEDKYTWVDKNIAIVAPISKARERASLERTAQWFLDNFQEAQLGGDVCVRLHLQWYDEDAEDMTALSSELAADTSIVAIVGPFTSPHVAIFAQACQRLEKPLIVPTVTSEEIIRRYAVPTQQGKKIVHPFLWSLTETDVAFTEVVMSAIAAYNQNFSQKVCSAWLSPNDAYGKTFFDWAPFQCENLGIDLKYNMQYDDTDQLLARLLDVMEAEKEYSYEITNFCVVKQLDQLVKIARMHREWMFKNFDFDIEGVPIDDPQYNIYAYYFERFMRCYYAFSDFSD